MADPTTVIANTPPARLASPGLDPARDYPDFTKEAAFLRNFMPNIYDMLGKAGNDREIAGYLGQHMGRVNLGFGASDLVQSGWEGFLWPIGLTRFFGEMMEGKKTIQFSVDEVNYASQIIPTELQKTHNSSFFTDPGGAIGDWMNALKACWQEGSLSNFWNYCTASQQERACISAFKELHKAGNGLNQAEAGFLTGVYPDSSGVLRVHFAPPFIQDKTERTNYEKYAQLTSSHPDGKGFFDYASDPSNIAYALGARVSLGVVSGAAVGGFKGARWLTKPATDMAGLATRGAQVGETVVSDMQAVRYYMQNGHTQAEAAQKVGTLRAQALTAAEIGADSTSAAAGSRTATLGRTISWLGKPLVGIGTGYVVIEDSLKMIESSKQCNTSAAVAQSILTAITVGGAGAALLGGTSVIGALPGAAIGVASIPVRYGAEWLFENALGIDLGNDQYVKDLVAIQQNTLNPADLRRATIGDVLHAIDHKSGPLYDYMMSLDIKPMGIMGAKGDGKLSMIAFVARRELAIKGKSPSDPFILPDNMKTNILGNEARDIDVKLSFPSFSQDTHYRAGDVAYDLQRQGPLYMHLQESGFSQEQIASVLKQATAQTGAMRAALPRIFEPGAMKDDKFTSQVFTLTEDVGSTKAGVSFTLPSKDSWTNYGIARAAQADAIIQKHMTDIQIRCGEIPAPVKQSAVEPAADKKTASLTAQEIEAINAPQSTKKPVFAQVVRTSTTLEVAEQAFPNRAFVPSALPADAKSKPAPQLQPTGYDVG